MLQLLHLVACILFPSRMVGTQRCRQMERRCLVRLDAGHGILVVDGPRAATAQLAAELRIRVPLRNGGTGSFSRLTWLFYFLPGPLSIHPLHALWLVLRLCDHGDAVALAEHNNQIRQHLYIAE